MKRQHCKRTPALSADLLVGQALGAAFLRLANYSSTLPSYRRATDRPSVVPSYRRAVLPSYRPSFVPSLRRAVQPSFCPTVLQSIQHTV